MKALLSIKPEFALRIFTGEKKFEYRRKIFKQQISSIIVYASSPMKLVIGEFQIEEIIHEELPLLWQKTRFGSGITKDYFYEYFNDMDQGYAIKIGKVTYFEVGLPLIENYGINPPQSYVYV